MHKKILSGILTLSMCFGMCGCGKTVNKLNDDELTVYNYIIADIEKEDSWLINAGDNVTNDEEFDVRDLKIYEISDIKDFEISKIAEKYCILQTSNGDFILWMDGSFDGNFTTAMVLKYALEDELDLGSNLKTEAGTTMDENLLNDAIQEYLEDEGYL